MKNSFKEPPRSDYLNEASSSRESEADQEIGPHTSSKNGDVPTTNASSRCIRHESKLCLTRMVLAEMVGTFILMFCVCGIIAITQLMGGEVGLLEYAATGGLSVVVVVFSIGSISGAHVNPSVTIAYATLGEFPWSKVPFYIFAQMVGSIFATYVGKSVYGIQAEKMTTRPLQGRSTAFWAEFIATFFIMFLAASLSSQARALAHLSGFVVGISIALAVLLTGPVSGGSMNPARSFGPAVISWRFDDIWLYFLAPTLGAVAGAVLFRVLRLQHQPCSSTSSSSHCPCAN